MSKLDAEGIVRRYRHLFGDKVYNPQVFGDAYDSSKDPISPNEHMVVFLDWLDAICDMFPELGCNYVGDFIGGTHAFHMGNALIVEMVWGLYTDHDVRMTWDARLDELVAPVVGFAEFTSAYPFKVYIK